MASEVRRAFQSLKRALHGVYTLLGFLALVALLPRLRAVVVVLLQFIHQRLKGGLSLSLQRTPPGLARLAGDRAEYFGHTCARMGARAPAASSTVEPRLSPGRRRTAQPSQPVTAAALGSSSTPLQVLEVAVCLSEMKNKWASVAKLVALAILPLSLAVVFARVGQPSTVTRTAKGQSNVSRYRRPVGVDNIWLGMPLKAFLPVRKNVKRGGAFAPTGAIDSRSTDIWLEENVDLAPRRAFQNISYIFNGGTLTQVGLVEYFEEDEMASRTQTFLAGVMNRYGAPTFLKVVKGVFSNRPGVYWRKNNVLIEAGYTLKSYRDGSKRLGFTQLRIERGSIEELLKRRLFVPLTKTEAEAFLLPVQDAVRKALRSVGRDSPHAIPVLATNKPRE